MKDYTLEELKGFLWFEEHADVYDENKARLIRYMMQQKEGGR